MACHTGLGRGSLPGRLLRLVFLISVWILGGYGAPSHLIPEPYNPIDKTIASLDKPRWQNAPPALVHRDSNNAQVDCWYLGQRYMDGMTMVSYGSRDHYTDGNIAIGCLRGSGYSGIISSAIVYEFDQKIIPPVTEPEDNRDTGGPTKNQIAKVTTDTTLYNVVPIMEKLTPDGSGLRGAAVKVHKAFQLAPNDVERIYKDLVPKGSDEDDSDDESGHGSFLLLEELDENGADLMKSFDSGNPGFDRFSMIDHLVRGITYAHQHGIFHGDIILANLMSTGQPDDWRIIDWDAAQEHPNLKDEEERRKNEDFATDVANVGLCLLTACSRAMVNDIGKDDLKNIINREIMTKELESSQVLDVLKDQLHLNVHAHPFLFAFVAQTLCKKAMRLTMDQVSYNMRYFSKQLPFLE